MSNFQERGTQLEIFFPRVNIFKGSYCILWIVIVRNWALSHKIKRLKNRNYQNTCSLKILMIFQMENWLWKSDFGTFCQFATISILQNTIISFEDIEFLAKNQSNFVYLVWKLVNPYYHSKSKYPTFLQHHWLVVQIF